MQALLVASFEITCSIRGLRKDHLGAVDVFWASMKIYTMKFKHTYTLDKPTLDSRPSEALGSNSSFLAASSIIAMSALNIIYLS